MQSIVKYRIVIDADGLWLISQNMDLVRGYKKCILTPNAVEFERLVAGAIDALSKSSSQSQSTTDAESASPTSPSSSSASVTDGDSDSSCPSSAESLSLLELLKSPIDTDRVRALCLALGGVTVFRKGANDTVSSGGDVYVIHEEGSPRRCGGQGDILAGCMGVASYWAWKVNISSSYIKHSLPLSFPM
jgi:ATP-dependent NAD(P)H-hydrate dehydratase